MADFLGSRVIVYGSTVALTTANATTLANVVAAKTALFETDIVLPYCTPADLGDYKMLFNSGVLNNATAQLFDEIAQYWFYQCPITYGQDKASGFTPQSIMNQFPALLDVNNYLSEYSAILVKPKNSNIYYVVSPAAGSVNNPYYYNEDTQAFGIANLFNILKFGSVTYKADSGTYTSYLKILLYNPVTEKIVSYDTSGAAATYRSNGSYGQLKTFTNYTPATEDGGFYASFSTGYDPFGRVDPYSGGGESEAGGGDGNFDFSSTEIPFPNIPTIGAMSTGFINLFNPSASQLRSLANYMWSGAFDISNFRKLVADPMDAILGLHIIPTVSGHPASTSATLAVGNISTGLDMPAVTEQYFEVDCGSVSIPAKWGAYLDYSPYTKLSLYLPYIGYVDISPDDCMRGSITVKYRIDVLSGSCIALVYCVSNRGNDGHVLYTFTGSCKCDCPVTEGQYTNGALGILGIIGSIGTGMADGGMSAGSAANALTGAINTGISMAKPNIKRSGSFGGAAGLMGIQYPYLILTIPHMCIPGQQNTYIGYPSFITLTMSELTGFTSIEVTHMNGMSCTQNEVDEIIKLLREGVIF